MTVKGTPAVSAFRTTSPGATALAVTGTAAAGIALFIIPVKLDAIERLLSGIPLPKAVSTTIWVYWFPLIITWTLSPILKFPVILSLSTCLTLFWPPKIRKSNAGESSGISIDPSLPPLQVTCVTSLFKMKLLSIDGEGFTWITPLKLVSGAQGLPVVEIV